MSQSVSEHRAGAPTSLNLAVVTVSDTRTVESDTSGALIVELVEAAGHRVAERVIVPDEPGVMRPLLQGFGARGDLHAILMTGGTGISPRDLTYETVSLLLSKPLPGFGELFRMLSYEQVGAAAMLSRATAGVYRGKLVISTPGSNAAVRLAWEKLIAPELQHLAWEVVR